MRPPPTLRPCNNHASESRPRSTCKPRLAYAARTWADRSQTGIAILSCPALPCPAHRRNERDRNRAPPIAQSHVRLPLGFCRKFRPPRGTGVASAAPQGCVRTAAERDLRRMLVATEYSQPSTASQHTSGRGSRGARRGVASMHARTRTSMPCDAVWARQIGARSNTRSDTGGNRAPSLFSAQEGRQASESCPPTKTTDVILVLERRMHLPPAERTKIHTAPETQPSGAHIRPTPYRERPADAIVRCPKRALRVT